MNKKQLVHISGFLAAALLVLGSCKTVEETETDHGSAVSQTDRTIGTVRSTDDCGFYIEVIKGDLSRSFYAINLDAKYQVDGMRLKFLWEEAKAKPPKDCPNFEPVELSDVTPLR